MMDKISNLLLPIAEKLSKNKISFSNKKMVLFQLCHWF